MASKGLLRFKNRLLKYREDCEMAEILARNKEKIKGSEFIFDKVIEADYPILSTRQNTAASRTLVVNHLRNTIYVSFIKEIYEELTEYLRYILKQGVQNGADTERLVGEHRVSLMANQVIGMVSKKDMVEYVMNQIFRQLENERSTISLISKIASKLGLNIDRAQIDTALPYLEIRHIFIHADGKPDADFRQRYPQFHLGLNRRIELNAELVNTAYTAIYNLVEAYDREMLRRNYFPESEIQP